MLIMNLFIRGPRAMWLPDMSTNPMLDCVQLGMFSVFPGLCFYSLFMPNANCTLWAAIKNVFAQYFLLMQGDTGHCISLAFTRSDTKCFTCHYVIMWSHEIINTVHGSRSNTFGSIQIQKAVLWVTTLTTPFQHSGIFPSAAVCLSWLPPLLITGSMFVNTACCQGGKTGSPQPPFRMTDRL